MKKIIFAVIALVIIYFVSCLYVGDFIVGYKVGHVIVYKHECADMYCWWSKKFSGTIDENTCTKIGGKPDYVTMAGVVDRGYNGCTPN